MEDGVVEDREDGLGVAIMGAGNDSQDWN
jgi:hypothetical protein